MSTNVIDHTAHVISEAEVKFDEKYKLVKAAGATGGVSFVAYPDRSFNLRQQVAHVQSLMSDNHFIELLGDIERCMLPEFSHRQEPDRKLQVILATLTKSMLRDVITSSTTTSSFAARKVQIEMIWQWWSDKQAQVLDITLMRKAAADPNNSSSPAVKFNDGTPAPLSPSLGASKNQLELARPEEATAEASQQRWATFIAPKNSAQQPTAPTDRVPPMRFLADAADVNDQAQVKRRLSLFKRRDLVKSEAMRQEALQCTRCAAHGGSDVAPPPVRTVVTKEARERQRSQTSRVPNDPRGMMLRTSGGAGPAGPVLWRGANAEDPELAAASTSTHAHIVRHMLSLADQAHDSRVAHDIVATMAMHQARLDEETARRIESDSVASQAGRTCQPILRRVRPATSPINGAFVSRQSTLPSASMEPDDVLSALHMTPYQGTDTSFSAYDHYKPNSVDERRLQAMMQRLRTVDDPTGEARKRFGLRSPDDSNMAGSSAVNAKPSSSIPVVAVAPTAAITPAVPRTGMALMEQLVPALRPEQDVPSLRRQKQIRLVERIRTAFACNVDAKGNPAPIALPRATIETALISPDDRPLEECLRNLPIPGSQYPGNPFPPSDKGSKKGGKKGGAKKK